MTVGDLRELLAKATKGPWMVEYGDFWGEQEKHVTAFRNEAGVDVIEPAYDTDYYDGICDVHVAIKKEDAALLIAAVNALPALLDAADALCLVIKRDGRLWDPLGNPTDAGEAAKAALTKLDGAT